MGTRSWHTWRASRAKNTGGWLGDCPLLSIRPPLNCRRPCTPYPLTLFRTPIHFTPLHLFREATGEVERATATWGISLKPSKPHTRPLGPYFQRCPNGAPSKRTLPNSMLNPVECCTPVPNPSAKQRCTEDDARGRGALRDYWRALLRQATSLVDRTKQVAKQRPTSKWLPQGPRPLVEKQVDQLNCRRWLRHCRPCFVLVVTTATSVAEWSLMGQRKGEKRYLGSEKAEKEKVEKSHHKVGVPRLTRQQGKGQGSSEVAVRAAGTAEIRLSQLFWEG